jgi:hypothetical protein
MDALGMMRVIVFGEESGILLAYLNLMNVMLDLFCRDGKEVTANWGVMWKT